MIRLYALIGTLVNADYSGVKIDKAKIVLHESYCVKNLFKCPKCGEMVNRREKEEHEEKQHKMVACEHCSILQEACKLKEHTENCNKRPKPCPFCELELNYNKYMEHIKVCGSRTEECLICGKFIRKADWAIHEESNCGINITEEKKTEDRKVTSTKPYESFKGISDPEMDYLTALQYEENGIPRVIHGAPMSRPM